jgi:hypothetical protein
VKLALLAEAEAELDDATAWYDEQRDGLGDELLLEVHDALAIIVDAPETWPRWPGVPPGSPTYSTNQALSPPALPLRDRLPGASRSDDRARHRPRSASPAVLGWSRPLSKSGQRAPSF